MKNFRFLITQIRCGNIKEEKKVVLSTSPQGTLESIMIPMSGDKNSVTPPISTFDHSPTSDTLALQYHRPILNVSAVCNDCSDNVACIRL